MKDEFYSQNICTHTHAYESGKDAVETETLPRFEKSEEGSVDCYYISDLHIDYKIYFKYHTEGTKSDIEKYIDEVVHSLMTTDDGQHIEFTPDSYILIGGDVALSWEICQIFYQKFNAALPEHVYCFVILGNHELAGFESVDQCVSTYRQFFYHTRMQFLHNEIMWNPKNGKTEKFDQVSGQDFSGELPVIIAGIGLSGLRLEYSKLPDKKQEQEISHELSKLHDIVRDINIKSNAIVFSHMPYLLWLESQLVERWYYINGHTHINVAHPEMNYYADNQVSRFFERIKLNKIVIK